MLSPGAASPAARAARVGRADEHPLAARPRPIGQLGEQPRLADARLAGDEGYPCRSSASSSRWRPTNSVEAVSVGPADCSRTMRCLLRRIRIAGDDQWERAAGRAAIALMPLPSRSARRWRLVTV